MDKRAERLRELQVKLHDLRKQANVVAQSLKDVAKELQKLFKNCHIVTMAGASAATVGTFMLAMGFGLSVFTGGATLGLAASGFGIMSAGSAVTVGAKIRARKFLRSNAYTDAEKLLKIFEQTRSTILIICNHIIDQLGQEGLENIYILLAIFLTRLIGGKSGISIADACELIRSTATLIQQGGEPASRFVLESAGVAGSPSKAMHVAGGVVGIALIPVDIAFLVNSALAALPDEQSEAAEQISDMAQKLLDMSPSEGEIDDMITHTIGKLRP